MIKIKTFTFNPFLENTIVLWSDTNKEGFVFDPGMSNEIEENEFKAFIAKEKIEIKKMINTHCHIDHILGCNFIKNNYDTEFLIPEKDLLLLEHYDRQMEMVGITMEKPPRPDKLINENEKLALNDCEIKPLFTPGHSPGEMCFLIGSENICITGDVLFKGSIGRTDLWGSNTEALFESIKNKLMILDNNISIYPGHGETSTIGEEKSSNPFLLELISKN